MKLFSAIEIEINSHCNLSCSYCPNSIEKRIEQGLMTIELYQKIIQDLQELNFQGRISYDFYNEPTLSPDLIYFITYAKTKLLNITIELYSNGTKIDFLFFKELENAGLDKLIITKHENINHYVFDKTYSELSIIQKQKVIFRSHLELNLTNRGGVMKQINSKISTALLPCQIPENMLTITNQGNVIPCFEDFFQENSMGNILHTSLFDIWNSEKYIIFRKKLSQGLRHNFEACKTCSRTAVLME